MNPIYEKQLNSFADYLLEKNRSQDTCFESLYAVVGGCLKQFEALAQAKGFKNKPSRRAEKSPQLYALQGYLDLKKKHAVKIHGCFVHWILSGNQLINVFIEYKDKSALLLKSDKWREINSDRLSDLIIDTHHSFPLERLNNSLLTSEGRAFLFHQLIIKKQNLLAKRLLTSEILEIPFLKNCTPLITAAKSKNEEMLNFLILKGANLEAKSTKGKTALWYALRYKFKRGFTILRLNGADIYKKSNNNLSVLFIAVMNQDIPLVKELLLDNKFDINEKTTGGIGILRYAKNEIINLILKDPRYKKSPFTSGGYYIDGGEIQGFKHPAFVKFSTLMRFLCLRYGITHTFKIDNLSVTYGSMFTNQVIEDTFESAEEYVKSLEGEEKTSWEKALEIVKWGHAHKGDFDKTHDQAPYGIMAYVATITYSSSSAHAVSIVISKKTSQAFIGNRNLSPYGIQVLSSISLNKMISYVKKTTEIKYRTFERLFNQTMSKFDSYSKTLVPHKRQEAPNCTLIAAKLNFESVLMALPDSSKEARNFYKRFTHYDRLRTLKKVLDSLKEIDRLASEMNLSRDDLREEGIVIEPVLEKIFFKSIKKGDLETIKLLLPLSSIQRDPDLYILQAYIHQQKELFNLFFRPTPLSTLLDGFDFKEVLLRNFVKDNIHHFLRIDEPSSLIELYIISFNKNISIPSLKDRVLMIPDLANKIQRILNARRYAEGNKTYPHTDQMIIQLFESLGLSSPQTFSPFFN